MTNRILAGIRVLLVVTGQFVSPVVLGRNLALSPLVIFVALIFWGWLWGIAGALIAVPLLASFNIVCRRVPGLEPVSRVLER